MAKKFLKVLDPKNLTGLADIFNGVRGCGVVLSNGAVWIASITKKDKILQRFKNIAAAKREFGELLEEGALSTIDKGIFTNCAKENASLFSKHPNEWAEVARAFDIKPPRSSGGVNNNYVGETGPNAHVVQAGNIDTGGQSLADFLEGKKRNR